MGYQFVVNTFDPPQSLDTLFKVKLGTGIGVRHAGSVSDLVFAEVAERPLLRRAAELGTSLFVWARDDVFVVVKDPQSSKMVREEFFRLSAPFCAVKLESYSLVGATSLDFI